MRLCNGIFGVRWRHAIAVSRENCWKACRQFSKMALWAGPMNGQDIFTTLVGGATHDFIGAVRAFGMGHKCIFEQMTSLDEVEMNISWQLITHPQNANLWPYSFLNNTTHVKVQKVHIPADHSYIIFGCGE
eukprot:jgi/Astpho2/5939/Aster-02425